MTSIERASGLALSGAQIVLFAIGPWHDLWRNRQHIFSRLARENLVLYVEPKIARWSQFRRGEVRWPDLREPRLIPQPEVAPGLWLYRHPLWAPRSRRPGLEALTRRLRWLALRQAMHALSIHAPITWLHHPRDSELVGTLGERLFVLHIVDDYAAYRHLPEQDRARVRQAEQELIRRADLVIVTAQSLLADRAPLNPHIALVPNAVDFERYAAARLAPAPPADIARLPRPIIGYSGHVSLRLDLPLLTELARQRPAWSFALVGTVWEKGSEAELAVLRSLPNVHFLGQKPAEQVPQYLMAFDVGLIPYRAGEEAKHINPLKLYEYLAAGKPIVTVDLPALDGFRSLVRVADDAAGFLQSVEAALLDQSPEAAAERRAVAAGHTWEGRTAEIARLVQARLAARTSD